MDVLQSDMGDRTEGYFLASTVVPQGESRHVELGADQCSLVVLYDTEAHYLRPLLTVQPSITMLY
jgi:hypothetical protein